MTVSASDVLPGFIDGVLPAGARVELVAEGFNGTEGPLALADGSMLFTENRADRIIHIALDGSTSTFLDRTNGSNALAMNPQGEIVAVQTIRPQLATIFPAGAERTLVAQFEGAAFLRPNDLVINRRGDIWFTDPGGPQPTTGATARIGVYHLPPGKPLERIDDSIALPNGVALSPDDRVLYVADTAGEWVIAFDVSRYGVVRNKRQFARLAGLRPPGSSAVTGGADGLAVDAAGRLYVATGTGVQVFDARGKALGVIALPKPPQNLAFGGPQRDFLYVVGRGAVYRIRTLTHGPLDRGK